LSSRSLVYCRDCAHPIGEGEAHYSEFHSPTACRLVFETLADAVKERPTPPTSRVQKIASATRGLALERRLVDTKYLTMLLSLFHLIVHASYCNRKRHVLPSSFTVVESQQRPFDLCITIACEDQGSPCRVIPNIDAGTDRRSPLGSVSRRSITEVCEVLDWDLVTTFSLAGLAGQVCNRTSLHRTMSPSSCVYACSNPLSEFLNCTA
jgi:hypothetical protein